MIKNTAFLQLREQAIALRRAGKSRREIKELLGIGSNQTLNEALRGEPPQPWTWRPNAKDDLRARARELREQGLAYHQIVAELGVSKGTVSAWVSDIPRPDRLSYEECCKRQAEGVARYWATERPLREAGREAISAAAAEEISALSDRETIIAGAVAYWCEGVKNKPYRRHDRVNFINSDPVMIKFFLRFLDVAGIPRDQVTFRVYVHESADVAAVQRFWLDVTRAGPGQFRRPTLKRHNPRTVRKNTGDGYHGCLRIDVRRSADLYRKIEGWATAAMTSVDSLDDSVKD
jgi:transcriptional regulator with XRE-family HTH domain